MKQQVLKALANPARIFYVPYSLAVMNFAAQFLIFILVFAIDLTVNGTDTVVNPLYFIISVIGVHLILATWSKQEPMLAQIIQAKIQLMKQRVGRSLRI